MKARIDQERMTSELARPPHVASMSADRAAALARRLLTFKRSHPRELEPVHINDVLWRMADLLTWTLGNRIELTMCLDDLPRPILCNAHELENAVLSLVANGRDAGRRQAHDRDVIRRNCHSRCNTGAASVGFRYLVRRDAKVAGIYGGGGQALHKVLALQNERTIKTYKVFSRNADNRKGFCARMAKLVDAEFVPVDTPREVMRGADVIICATNSNVPVFDGAWIEPGQHIVTVVGSNAALVEGSWLKERRRESDDETARRADFIITTDMMDTGAGTNR